MPDYLKKTRHPKLHIYITFINPLLWGNSVVNVFLFRDHQQVTVSAFFPSANDKSQSVYSFDIRKIVIMAEACVMNTQWAHILKTHSFTSSIAYHQLQSFIT